MRASDLGFRRFVAGQSAQVCGQTRRLFPFRMLGAGLIELWWQSFRRRPVSRRVKACALSTFSLPNRSHAVSQYREREAVDTALLCTARPQMVRARWLHVLADSGALMRDGACSITPVAGRHPPVGAPVVVARRGKAAE